jgi:ABC-type multidrug transport system ATPase subunit
MISAKGISKAFQKNLILSNIELTASSGKAVVIVGKNGAGKSTLLSILAGYLKPDAGNVDTGGHTVAFCPHSDDLFEELTVRDNILFWQRARGADSNQNAVNLTQLLEVDTYQQKRVGHLSAGMKKCVALVCALAGNPTVLILDEPFTGLDIFYKNALLKAFETLLAQGICIIYTSHATDETAGVNSDVYTLSGGCLSYAGTSESLREKGSGMMEHLLSKLA